VVAVHNNILVLQQVCSLSLQTIVTVEIDLLRYFLQMPTRRMTNFRQDKRHYNTNYFSLSLLLHITCHVITVISLMSHDGVLNTRYIGHSEIGHSLWNAAVQIITRTTKKIDSDGSVMETIYGGFEPHKIRAPTHAIPMTSSSLPFPLHALKTFDHLCLWKAVFPLLLTSAAPSHPSAKTSAIWLHTQSLDY